MKTIDEASFAEGMSKLRADLAPMVDAPGQKGADARCLIAASEPLHRFITTEMARCTEPADIFSAVSNLTANIVMSLLHNLNVDDGVEVAGWFMEETAQRLGFLLREKPSEVSSTDIKIVETGTA